MLFSDLGGRAPNEKNTGILIQRETITSVMLIWEENVGVLFKLIKIVLVNVRTPSLFGGLIYPCTSQAVSDRLEPEPSKQQQEERMLSVSSCVRGLNRSRGSLLTGHFPAPAHYTP